MKKTGKNYTHDNKSGYKINDDYPRMLFLLYLSQAILIRKIHLLN